MSGSLGFIRSNPATAGFDSMDRRLAQQEQRANARGTDAAIRGGIQDMMAPPAPPSAAPAPAPAAPPPTAAPGAPQGQGLAAVQATTAPAAAPPAAAPAPPPARPAPAQNANPYAPVLSRLATAPGGGQAALGLLQRGESENTRRIVGTARAGAQQDAATARARAASERNVLMALGKGQVEVARAFARQAGIELPQNIVAAGSGRGGSGGGREGLQRLARAGLLARTHYGNDPDQGHTFMETFMRTGDANAALTAAGRPRSAPGNWRPTWVQEEDRELLYFFNPRTRQMEPAQRPGGAPGTAPAAPAPAGAEGEPAAAPATPPAAGAPGQYSRPARGAGSAARPLDRAARRDMLVAGGFSEQEANAIAGGAAVSPSQRARAAASARSSAERDVYTQGPGREREVNERAAAILRAFDEGGQRPGASAPAPARPAAPPPPAAPVDRATPPPAAPPATPPAAQRNLPQPRSRQEYDALPNGSQYMDPNGRVRTKGAA